MRSEAMVDSHRASAYHIVLVMVPYIRWLVAVPVKFPRRGPKEEECQLSAPPDLFSSTLRAIDPEVLILSWSSYCGKWCDQHSWMAVAAERCWRLWCVDSASWYVKEVALVTTHQNQLKQLQCMFYYALLNISLCGYYSLCRLTYISPVEMKKYH